MRASAPEPAPIGVHKGHRDHKKGPRQNGRTWHGNVEIATSCADKEGDECYRLFSNVGSGSTPGGPARIRPRIRANREHGRFRLILLDVLKNQEPSCSIPVTRHGSFARQNSFPFDPHPIVLSMRSGLSGVKGRAYKRLIMIAGTRTDQRCHSSGIFSRMSRMEGASATTVREPSGASDVDKAEIAIRDLLDGIAPQRSNATCFLRERIL